MRTERLGPLQKFLLRSIRRRAKVPNDLNVFRILVRLGTIFPRYVPFFANLLRKGRIGRADKERVILRVAWRLGCIYEWGHHAHLGRQFGLSEDEILSFAEERSSLWSVRTQALIAATDELVQHRCVGDDAWESLRRELSEDESIEFCMLVGHYVMVAGIINTVGIELEPGYL